MLRWCAPILWWLTVSAQQQNRGCFHAYTPNNQGSGQLPESVAVEFDPPTTWGRTGWLDNTQSVDASGVWSSDKVEISLASYEGDIYNSETTGSLSYVPFNQYPSMPYTQYNSGGNPLVVSSNPACQFYLSVAAGGVKATLYLLQCANNPVPQPPLTPGIALLDSLIVRIPHWYLAINPSAPQVAVQMQATFFVWTGVDGNNVNTYSVFGPALANSNWKTTTPQLSASELHFLEFYPGVPGGKPNTIAGTQLEALTLSFILGVQQQAGDTATLSVNIGAVDVNDPALPAVGPGNAGPKVQPTNLIFSAATPANTYIAVGTTCGSGVASVNCCHQTTAEVSSPYLSVLTASTWWRDLIWTFGPVGCVLPSGRKITVTIPKAYLGLNPSQRITNPGPANPGSQGFRAVDARLSTSGESQQSLYQRFSNHAPLGFVGNAAWGEATGPSPVIAPVDLMYTQGASDYVVGPSAVAALTVAPDTIVAYQIPTKMDVAVTLTTSLPAIPDETVDTPYALLLNANTGIFKPNSGTFANSLQLTNVLPSACSSYVNAIVLSDQTFLAYFRNAACVAALKSGTIFSFRVPGTMLLRNPAVGTVVKFTVRLVPSMDSVATGSAVTTIDSAATMNVIGYTTVADCGTIGYQPGVVNDVLTSSYASRCALVNAVNSISPGPYGFLQCPPNANLANGQNLVSYVKIAEGAMFPAIWPGATVPAAWPQGVALPGTPPVYVLNWGLMFSNPMFAILVSYPPTFQNLQAMGTSPAIGKGWQVAFIIKMSRLTTACSMVVDTQNPWSFRVETSLNIVSVVYFPMSPVVAQGIAVGSSANTFWGRSGNNVFITVVTDAAVVGFYAAGVSPLPSGDGSDAAWFAFFAFFAIPCCLLCLCLLAALYFLKKKRSEPCCCPVPVQQDCGMYYAPPAPVCSASYITTECAVPVNSPCATPYLPTAYLQSAAVGPCSPRGVAAPQFFY